MDNKKRYIGGSVTISIAEYDELRRVNSIYESFIEQHTEHSPVIIRTEDIDGNVNYSFVDESMKGQSPFHDEIKTLIQRYEDVCLRMFESIRKHPEMKEGIEQYKFPKDFDYKVLHKYPIVWYRHICAKLGIKQS